MTRPMRTALFTAAVGALVEVTGAVVLVVMAVQPG